MVQHLANYESGTTARHFQDLLDAAKAVSTFLPSSNVEIDDKLLDEYIRTQHLSGMIIVDARG